MNSKNIIEQDLKAQLNVLLGNITKVVDDFNIQVLVQETFSISRFTSSNDVEDFLKNFSERIIKSKASIYLYAFDCASADDSKLLADLFLEYREQEKKKNKSDKHALCATNAATSEDSNTLYVGKSEGNILGRIEDHIGFDMGHKSTWALKLYHWMNKDIAKYVKLTLTIYEIKSTEKIEAHHKVALRLLEESLRAIKKPRLGR